MAVDWTQIKIIDGWTVNRTASGYTLTAQLYSSSRDYFPSRGDKLPITGLNAVERQFVAYRISDVQTTALSAAGPYLAQVTATGGIQPKHFNGDANSVLSQTDLRTGYMDYHMQPQWAGLKAGSEESLKPINILIGYSNEKSNPTPLYPIQNVEWYPGKWVSIFDKAGVWTNWSVKFAEALQGNSGHLPGSLFTRMVHPYLADTTLRFLSVTVTFHVKETSVGLENWGGFSGIVPVNSFPKWIAIPGGDNRWRLYDEEIERVIETDGTTVLFKVTRVLLGIPNEARDVANNRLEWDQKTIGQRDWDDL